MIDIKTKFIYDRESKKIIYIEFDSDDIIENFPEIMGIMNEYKSVLLPAVFNFTIESGEDNRGGILKNYSVLDFDNMEEDEVLEAQRDLNRYIDLYKSKDFENAFKKGKFEKVVLSISEDEGFSLAIENELLEEINDEYLCHILMIHLMNVLRYGLFLEDEKRLLVSFYIEDIIFSKEIYITYLNYMTDLNMDYDKSMNILMKKTKELFNKFIFQYIYDEQSVIYTNMKLQPESFADDEEVMVQDALLEEHCFIQYNRKKRIGGYN